MREQAACPHCGTGLSGEPWTAGLCPHCSLRLALEQPDEPTEISDSDEGREAPTIAYPADSLSEGQMLGDRYRIRALLGRGGMGEVWRAVDLKLRVDVALKALRAELLSDERALESLRQEVRLAREVVSPNICRVFDLLEIEGRELVSMEYIDGVTLLDVLKMRAPLDLTEAREIAAQFLAGLEAIHEAGLVHRDVKPENLMMTRSGRIVLMDFGIAKDLAEGRTGTVSGTPAYMAPEQARGDSPDARVDVFSAGVVLAEMIAPDGLATLETRQAIWRGVHGETPSVPDSPWADVLIKAVARAPEQRYASAAALARALEEVTLRADRADDLSPYPGLASFGEADAEYFFGRELEVEEMWKKLRRPQLYGLIGPSGAGKSSFLHAGLRPLAPTGWSTILTAPGSQPFSNLARALVPEVSDDTEALQLLVQANDAESILEVAGRWRVRHDQVLLVLDQFEELFTQNPPEVQKSFADLLGQVAVESDAHVLLSMRDDFLFYCSAQPALSPMFSELTPLRAPSGSSLHRALVQPALKCGYRFEDDSLVDEMVDEVHEERGALPMLAFAAARLWQHRDREEGLLTRQAYEHIGGVGGALAQHAEQTLERIGQDNIPIVRELFRNLMTSQSTRVARDREELLSVFGDSERPLASSADPTSPEVFLSYSRTDFDAAKRLASSLEAEGFTVWWDRDITPGTSFDKAIETALAEARAVVVLWSEDSVDSNWVKAEAAEALERGRLVPVLIDRVKPPLEFRRLEAAELYSGSGEAARHERQQLTAALRALTERSRPSPRGHAQPRTAASSPRLTAEQVLDTLIDARLLTSYEPASSADGEARSQRIEIVHESLLSSWPRLVRWQTQDQDGALLRDQLRQAAQMWEERDHPEDLLWTGTSYDEYQLWRERYSGGLSTAEESFARAMTSHAERRKRRRRLVLAAVIAVLAIGLGVVGSLWRQAEVARARAEQETLRAEASHFLGLGRLEIDQNPTTALAYALAALERADSPVARLFALEALWRGPPAFMLDSDYFGLSLDFSSNGRWLANTTAPPGVELWSSAGGPPKRIPISQEGMLRNLRFGPDSDVMAALDFREKVAHLISVPEAEVIRTLSLPSDGHPEIRLPKQLNRLITFAQSGRLTEVTSIPLDGGPTESYGEFDRDLRRHTGFTPRWVVEVDPTGTRLAFLPFTEDSPQDAMRRLYVAPMNALPSATPELVGTHQEMVMSLAFHPGGELLAAGEMAGEIRLWSLADETSEPRRILYSEGGAYGLSFDPSGSKLAAESGSGHTFLWDLAGPPDANPLTLRGAAGIDGAFHPDGRWFAAAGDRLTLFPIERRYPIDLEGHEDGIFDLAFLPDGSALLSTSADGTFRIWPLSAAAGDGSRVLFDSGGLFVRGLSIGPGGKQVLTTEPSTAWLLSVDGEERRRLGDLEGGEIALGPRGRLAASGSGTPGVGIRVLDLETGDIRTLDAGEDRQVFYVRFTPDGRLISFTNKENTDESDLRIWTLEDGSYEVLSDVGGIFDLTPDGRFLLAMRQTADREPVLYDLANGTSLPLSSHGDASEVALDVTGRIAVTRRSDGHGQVGLVTGEAPHLLVSSGDFKDPVVSPDGQWIAAAHGNTIRLWPMPDMSQPPLHTLPLDRLLDKLRSLTNLRVVPDPESETGWGLDLDPFPGWEEVPTW